MYIKSIFSIALLATSVAAHGKVSVATGDAGGNGTALGSKLLMFLITECADTSQSRVASSQGQAPTRSPSQIPPYSRVTPQMAAV